jgi:hypothetical protein
MSVGLAIIGWTVALVAFTLWLRAEYGWALSIERADAATEAWKLVLVQRDEARRRLDARREPLRGFSIDQTVSYTPDIVLNAPHSSAASVSQNNETPKADTP